MKIVKGSKSAGFSLVELLVVISVIAILASLLIPSVTRALVSGRTVRTQAIIKSFNDGLNKWYLDNRHTYPGQRKEHWSDGFFGDGVAAPTTGSQLLTRAMFTSKEGNFPTDGYVPFSSNLVKADINGVHCISDDYPDEEPRKDQHPILYFPSRMGNKGTVEDAFVTELYKDGDNSWQINAGHVAENPPPDSDPLDRFKWLAADPRFSVKVGGVDVPKGLHTESFLLIAAGEDGKYFTEDDVKNWQDDTKNWNDAP